MSDKKNSYLFLAFVASAVTPALMFGVLSLSLKIIPITFFVASIHALLLGVPLFLVLSHKGWVNVVTCAIGGFVIGSFLIGIIFWPWSPGNGSNATIGDTKTIIDGVPTFDGWLYYLKSVSFFGLIGASGGLGFWLTLRTVSGSKISRFGQIEDSGRAPLHLKILMSFVLLLSIGVFFIPSVTKDRTCHNTMRDGRSSISSVLNIDLDIEYKDWDVLKEEFVSFSNSNSLSFRDSSTVHPDDFVRILYLSLCNEGLAITVNEQRWKNRDYAPIFRGYGVGIRVYEVYENSGWEDLLNKFITGLENRWPGKIRYRDHGGRVIPKPI